MLTNEELDALSAGWLCVETYCRGEQMNWLLVVGAALLGAVFGLLFQLVLIAFSPMSSEITNYLSEQRISATAILLASSFALIAAWIAWTVNP